MSGSKLWVWLKNGGKCWLWHCASAASCSGSTGDYGPVPALTHGCCCRHVADEMDTLQLSSRPVSHTARSSAASPEAMAASTSASSLSRASSGVGGSMSSSASPQPHQAAGGPFRGDLVGLLRRIAALRADGQALRPEEWKSYAKVRVLTPAPSERTSLVLPWGH